jgi:hypothetical protein
VVELKMLLETKGLDTTGRKAQLVVRLKVLYGSFFYVVFQMP